MSERTPPRAASRRAGHVALAFVVGLVGFLLVTQYQSRRDLEGRLAAERESDLAQLLSDLGARSDQLQAEIVELRVRLAGAASSSERESVLLDNARVELQSVQILLGLVPVAGEGIEVVIEDPDGELGPDVIVDIVQELRDAGAEAIELGGVRVVASTAVTGSPGALEVDGAAVRSPIRILAIGEGSTLAQALHIPGGVEDVIRERGRAGITVAARPRVIIASLHPLPRFSYATPS
jgi:uncharacterized protein YlxW (UPF0749 family)